LATQAPPLRQSKDTFSGDSANCVSKLHKKWYETRSIADRKASTKACAGTTNS